MNTHDSIRHFQLSSPRMTVWVSISDNNLILDTAPITRKFVGQNVNNLVRWMKRQGDIRVFDLTESHKVEES